MEVSHSCVCDADAVGTELDTHSNMVVVGSQSYVFSHSGKLFNVRAFSEESSSIEDFLIVDDVIAYDCHFSGNTYLLVCINVLFVPSMMNNLIPLFVMIEAGLIVSDTPKIHCSDPSVEDHSIYDPESELCIHLSLQGIFSTFCSRAPSVREIDEVELYPTVLLTPDSNEWDP